MFVIKLDGAASRVIKGFDESMYPINFHLRKRPLRQDICYILQFWLILAAHSRKYQLKRICISSAALSDTSYTIRVGRITF